MVMGGLIIFCVVLLIATMAHWHQFRAYFLTTLVWLVFYYVGPFMVPITYRKQNAHAPTSSTSADAKGLRNLGKASRGWLIVRGFLYLTLAVFWLAQADVLATVWPWQIGPLELRVFTGQLAIIGWNAIVVLTGRYSWNNMRLGLVLGGAIGSVQLIGLMLSSTPYTMSGLGVFLPVMFAEWLVTPLILFINYEWKKAGPSVAPPNFPAPSGVISQKSFVQFGARLLGTFYTAFGILGFLPIRVFNPMHHESVGARYLFNLVAINAAHNVIHLAIGITGILASDYEVRARLWGILCGSVLLLVFAGGVIQACLEGLPSDQMFLGLVPLNSPGHILHLVTGSIALYLGMAAPDKAE